MSRSVKVALASAAAALLLASCDKVEIVDVDAGADAVVHDADGGEEDPRLAPLLGPYAVRSTYLAFSQMGAAIEGGNISWTELLYGILERGKDGPVLRLRSCYWENNYVYHPLIALSKELLSQMPERTLPFQLRDCDEHPDGCWETGTSEPFDLGYRPAPECNGKSGTILTGASWVLWGTKSECVCADDPNAPIRSDQPNDCRVKMVGSEGPPHPGFWITFARQAQAHLAYRATSAYVRGFIDAEDGLLIAEERRDDAFSFFWCEPDVFCHSDGVLCPIEDAVPHSKVELVRLQKLPWLNPEAPADKICEAIIGQKDSLWGPSPELAGCAPADATTPPAFTGLFE